MNEISKSTKLPLNGKQKAAKIIAIVLFALVMSALLAAFISDAVLLAEQIFYFIIACIGSVVVFIVGFILLLISLILVFGFYLIEQQGFWPVTWAQQGFNEILAEGKLTAEQINILVIIRIVLLIACVVVFILAIVALVLAKVPKAERKQKKQKLTKACSIVGLILSILGVFAATVVMTLLLLISL